MKTLHLPQIILFATLSLTDLFLTWALLHYTSGLIYETNPIARALMGEFGWMGVVVFKVAMIAMIAGLCLIISMQRPHLSNRILLFACSATGLVVIYSCSLLGFVV